MLNNPMSDALGRYLDLQTQRMQLTAGNMANVETPGYRTRDLDLQSEFARTLLEHGVPGAAPGSVLPGVPAGQEVDGLIARPDGNNVSMDRESMQMAQTQLQFRTGVELLRHQFTLLSEAIRSEGK